ncbi:MAG: hypothetical protein P4L49_02625 [Desulfosporosinus sp.]|nr:hypothetical protein [Desulfosporosinus sp.]
MRKGLIKGAMIGLTILSSLGVITAPALASLPDGSVIFGDGNAYDLNYANFSAQAVIQSEVVNSKNQIWVKNYSGIIVDNATGDTVPVSAVPTMLTFNGQPVILDK